MMNESHTASTCVTVNQRLARALKSAFDAERLAEGLLSWETPDILPFSAWLARTWCAAYGRNIANGGDAAIRGTILLDPFQEHALWARIIRETEGGAETAGMGLLQVSRAAGHAMSAWARIKGWRIPEEEYRAAWDEDARMFVHWTGVFVERCREKAWIDPGSALDVLIKIIRADSIALPERFVFAGFDVFTPQQQELLDALEGTGQGRVSLSEAGPQDPAKPGHCVRVTPADEEKELEAAARWARALMERGVSGPIGVVIPELAEKRPAVLRVFDEILYPEAKWQDGGLAHPEDSARPAPVSPRPFNLSLGEPLAAIPLVRDAMLALTLADGRRHPVSSFSQFLLSPYFAGTDADPMVPTRLDLSLRAMGEPWLTLTGFCHFLASGADTDESDGSDAACNSDESGFRAKLLEELTPLTGHQPAGATEEARRRALPAKAPLSHWARIFAERLGDLGWPGDRTPNSDEYQGIGAFHELLAEFAGLTLILNECSFPVALSWLRQIAEKRIFQPKPTIASARAPVQILGVREAAGLSFPHLWILGLHADVWPPPPRPNPFLPIGLQRRAGMPGAGPDTALAEARRAMETLLARAGEAVVSHPGTCGDLDTAPSPLITVFPEVAVTEIPQSEYQSGALSAPYGEAGAVDGEVFLDERGPPLGKPASPGRIREALRGGTGIWQDQAACPFRAFARHRLGATGLDVPTVGLDYAVRGIMAHRALESVWRDLRDSDRLNRMDDETLRRHVEKAAGEALLAMAEKRPETLRGRLRELERTRLVELLMEWLAFEKTRPPFTVTAPERGRVIRFEDLLPEARDTLSGEDEENALPPMALTLRPDRVDRTADGRYLVIDYKTGRAAVGDWFGQRPASLQLPLYAVAEECDGIGFAFVRRGEMGLAGLAEPPDMAPGIESVEKAKRVAGRFDDWDGLRSEWRRTLVLLAEAFARGDAEVDPADPPGVTCRYCELHYLCRIA